MKSNYDFRFKDGIVSCILTTECELHISKHKRNLIEFLRKKDEIIHTNSGRYLYGGDDYKEIFEEWTDEMCKNFLSSNLLRIDDSSMCPWCYFHSYTMDKCLTCNYGKRHIYCNDKESDYGKVKSILYTKIKYRILDDSRISKLPGMNVIIRKYCDMYHHKE